jgi:hypothetical protein
VLAFGAAPVKTAVLAGTQSGQDLRGEARHEKQHRVSARVRGRVDTDLDLRRLGNLADCRRHLTGAIDPGGRLAMGLMAVLLFHSCPKFREEPLPQERVVWKDWERGNSCAFSAFLVSAR